MKLVILTKAKYIKRWKGKNGEWQYKYANQKQSMSPSDITKLNAREFDAIKIGWSMQDAKNKGIEYSKQNPGKYITMTADFGVVSFRIHNSLPKSDYAPGDYEAGYAYNGKWKSWSDARKIKKTNRMLGYGEGSDL